MNAQWNCKKRNPKLLILCIARLVCLFDIFIWVFSFLWSIIHSCLKLNSHYSQRPKSSMSNVEWIYGDIRGETEHRNKLLKDKVKCMNFLRVYLNIYWFELGSVNLEVLRSAPPIGVKRVAEKKRRNKIRKVLIDCSFKLAIAD